MVSNGRGGSEKEGEMGVEGWWVVETRGIPGLDCVAPSRRWVVDEARGWRKVGNLYVLGRGIGTPLGERGLGPSDKERHKGSQVVVFFRAARVAAVVTASATTSLSLSLEDGTGPVRVQQSPACFEVHCNTAGTSNFKRRSGRRARCVDEGQRHSDHEDTLML